MVQLRIFGLLNKCLPAEQVAFYHIFLNSLNHQTTCGSFERHLADSKTTSAIYPHTQHVLVLYRYLHPRTIANNPRRVWLRAATLEADSSPQVGDNRYATT